MSVHKLTTSTIENGGFTYLIALIPKVEWNFLR